MIYFINIKDFVNKVKFSNSIKAADILPFIRSTQITHIKRIIGSDLYESIQEEMRVNVLSPEIQALFPYLKDVHVYYSFQEFLYWANANITEYGLVSKNADESTRLTKEDLANLIEWAKSTGDTFCFELRNFLYNNKEDYPLWRSNLTKWYIAGGFNGGMNWTNVGKNLTGKRTSVKIEEANKTYDFDTIYKCWCNKNNWV